MEKTDETAKKTPKGQTKRKEEKEEEHTCEEWQHAMHTHYKH
jgi:hypothetical protein